VIQRIEKVLKGMLSDPSVAVRLAASTALDRLRGKRSVSSYLRMLEAGSLEERVRVVFAAEEMGGAEGITILLAALSNREREVRGAAVRALESSLTGTVIDAMVARLPREEGVVLGNLLEALGKSRRTGLVLVVERYLDHPDAEVRSKAVHAVARLGEGAVWEKVLARAADQDETVRAAAARALGEWSAG
jgi:predicted ATP-grasp superfamily ATP-dependent carboligase